MIKWLVAVALLFASPLAADCRDARFLGKSFTVCEADMAQEDVRLFLRNSGGGIYGHFSQVNETLKAQGKQLGFAMNAGMYHENRAPVGLYLEQGKQEQGLITSDGPGNFGLLPNGVFCIKDSTAHVIESRTFDRTAPQCTYASQSGPMLVIDGALHPRFLPDSTSRYIRNGVGVNADGSRAIFVMSRNTVTFHEFGTFFREVLGTPNALYFDGNISRLYAPEIGSYGPGWRMGPIVGTVIPLSD